MKRIIDRNETMRRRVSSSPLRRGIAVIVPLVLGVLTGASALATAAEPRLLTLDQALQIARENNKEIRKAHEYGHSVQGRYVEERSAALPQLALTGSASVARDE